MLVMGILFATSLGLSVYCSYFHPMLNFYFLPPRAWELLLGAMLAVLPARNFSAPGAIREAVGWAGLLGILCAAVFYTRETRFPGATALLPCIGTGLIIWANGQNLTSVGRFLALRPVVFIGLISYSLYLWHWPVLVFAKYWAVDPLGQGQRWLLLLASLILAWLSWKFVETPFRQRVILKTRPQVFTFAGTATASLLVIGVTIFLLHGMPTRLPAAALQYANIETKTSWDRDLPLKDAMAGNFFELAAGNKKQSPIDLLVWGDSHAMSVMPILDLLSKEHAINGVAATHSASPPLLGYVSKQTDLKSDTIAYNKAIVDFIHSRRVRNVILVARWGVYLTDSREANRIQRCLFETIDKLQHPGVKIWILRQVPKQAWNVPNTLAVTVWRGDDPAQLGLSLEAQRAESQRQDFIFKGLVEKFPNVSILDPSNYFLGTNNLCRVVKDGEALYFDDNHLTIAGSMLLRPLFEPIFEGIKKD
jgi:hypothetical protein